MTSNAHVRRTLVLDVSARLSVFLLDVYRLKYIVYSEKVHGLREYAGQHSREESYDAPPPHNQTSR